MHGTCFNAGACVAQSAIDDALDSDNAAAALIELIMSTAESAPQVGQESLPESTDEETSEESPPESTDEEEQESLSESTDEEEQESLSESGEETLAGLQSSKTQVVSQYRARSITIDNVTHHNCTVSLNEHEDAFEFRLEHYVEIPFDKISVYKVLKDLKESRVAIRTRKIEWLGSSKEVYVLIELTDFKEWWSFEKKFVLRPVHRGQPHTVKNVWETLGTLRDYERLVKFVEASPLTPPSDTSRIAPPNSIPVAMAEWNQLPVEVLGRVLMFLNELNVYVLLRTPCVSQQWRQACAKWLEARIDLSCAWDDCLTDAGLQSILRQFPMAIAISLANRENITNIGIEQLAATCTQLTSIDLFRCRKVTDEGVAKLAAGCPKLTCLDLTNCSQVTDKGVTKLAAGCPQLTSLNLNDCREVTDEAVARLAAGCPQLTALDLNNCREVTDEAVARLAAGCPQLVVSFYHRF